MSNQNHNTDLKPIAISLLSCLPGALLLFYFMQSGTISWWAPQILFSGLIALAIIDFILLNYLDGYRKKINRMTFITLSASIMFIFLFAIFKVSQDMFSDVGYDLLLPGVTGLLLFSIIGIFKEKQRLLKYYLGVNTMALSLLWGLGASNAIYLP